MIKVKSNLVPVKRSWQQRDSDVISGTVKKSVMANASQSGGFARRTSHDPQTRFQLRPVNATQTVLVTTRQLITDIEIQVVENRADVLFGSSS